MRRGGLQFYAGGKGVLWGLKYKITNVNMLSRRKKNYLQKREFIKDTISDLIRIDYILSVIKDVGILSLQMCDENTSATNQGIVH